MRRSRGEYPPDWPTISERVRAEAGWKCVRCDHPHAPRAGRTLTVHHLDLDPSNNRWWNLAALCQACHLHIQGKVILERPWLFEHSAWFRPYVAGYYAAQLGRDDAREVVMQAIDELIAAGTR